MALFDHLNALESSGLIFLAASQPELECLFRHVLVQEAAYSWLVKTDRRGLHLAVGEAREHAYPERLVSRQLALVQREHERAVNLAADLLADLRQFGARPYLPEALHLQAQAWMAAGQGDPAHRSLMEARSEAEALGSRRRLWQILLDLSRLEARRGNAAETDGLRRQAREIVEYIADHAGTPELRASFLNVPAVRAVWGGT